MSDPSMERTLSAQAEAIWPQERPLIEAYGLPSDVRILDAGCGTGEGTIRLASMFDEATIMGVDLLESSLETARARARSLGSRVRFERQSIFRLEFEDGAFDFAVCRHVLQAVPNPERAIAELVRVTRAGGRIHLIAEDYAMIHFPNRSIEMGEGVRLWPDAPAAFGQKIGTDMMIGRRAPSVLRSLGLVEITVHFVVVDTLRVPRDVFATIWEAWRDGYVDVLAEALVTSPESVRRSFDAEIAALLDPAQYAVWFVPVVSGRLPGP